MANAWMPSSFLPEFLQSDLGVGRSDMDPLLSALDAVATRVSQRTAERSLDLVSAFSSTAWRRQGLERLGFRCDVLAPEEIHAFYDQIRPILAHSGFLSSVEAIAQIYFPGSRCTLGRPSAVGRMGQSHHVRIGDTQDRRRLIFVRTANSAGADRVEELLHNLARILPIPYQALVAFPRTAAKRPERWSLSTARSWEKRRIECRISPK